MEGSDHAPPPDELALVRLELFRARLYERLDGVPYVAVLHCRQDGRPDSLTVTARNDRPAGLIRRLIAVSTITHTPTQAVEQLAGRLAAEIRRELDGGLARFDPREECHEVDVDVVNRFRALLASLEPVELYGGPYHGCRFWKLGAAEVVVPVTESQLVALYQVAADGRAYYQRIIDRRDPNEPAEPEDDEAVDLETDF